MLSVLRGSDSGRCFELTHKMNIVDIAALRSDTAYRAVGVGKKIFSVLNACGDDVGHDADTENLLVKMLKIGFTQHDLLRERGNAARLTRMAVDF